MRLPVIVLLSTVSSGLVTAILMLSFPYSGIAHAWFFLGLALAEVINNVVPPTTETHEGLSAALGIVISWLFWAVVASLALVLYKHAANVRKAT